MIVNKIKIKDIPAILWGENSSKMIIAAHGSHSSKIDDCIWILAEEATLLGYQVLSFDFPKHGERIYETEPCMAQTCVAELQTILEYAKSKAEEISVFGCSMGAYFSLLAYKNEKIAQALFLSPVVDMEKLIHNLMIQFNVTEEELREKKVIENPFETLYWDYYAYVKAHPVEGWEHNTSILYGEFDNLCGFDDVSAFARRYQCDLEVQKGGEHWFHTEEELEYFREWVKRRLD